ncbi:MAG: hypothetical protein A2W19_10185 [Spirochaetes bacterium RBG_16_49_21]|nr:MAG: hypothetical protein A2W19_10185 [Spirochaetes bacterium RBG_16_49_21]
MNFFLDIQSYQRFLLWKGNHPMFGNKFPAAICMLLALIVTGCATSRLITVDGIKTETASIKNDITRDRANINKLKNIRVGATGFYYVVDTDGMVVFHPQSSLIGVSFKNHWFINRVIAEKSGCLTYRLGLRTYLILYEPLNDSEILCLSILTEDVRSLPPECGQSGVK